MTETGVNSINTTALAFIGDAVYEVFIRNRVLCKYGQNADRLHREAVRYVKADAQAEVVRRLTEEGFLTEEEENLVRRARNRRIKSKARGASPMDYKLATAFEALIGCLHLSGRSERAEEVMEKAAEIIETPRERTEK